MTLVLMALFFLVLEQRGIAKKKSAITVPQVARALRCLLEPRIDRNTLARQVSDQLVRNEVSRIDHWREHASRMAPPRIAVA